MDKVLIEQMDRVELVDTAKLVLDELSEEDAIELIEEYLSANDMTDVLLAQLEGRNGD